MDELNERALREIFGVGGARLVPIFTEVATARAAPRDELRIAWVGRLADFKAEPLVAFARELDAFARSRSPRPRFSVIGDGPQARQVQRELQTLKNIDVRLLGHLDIVDLKKFLVSECDVMVGHALAALEAASVALPTLIVDGHYLKLRRGEQRARWLYEEPPGDTGLIVQRRADMRGRPVQDVLQDLVEPGAAASLGSACLVHWLAHHSADHVALEGLEGIENAQFTYQDYLALGMGRQDALAAGVDSVKRMIHHIRGIPAHAWAHPSEGK
jgi:hypothetical protein